MPSIKKKSVVLWIPEKKLVLGIAVALSSDIEI